MKKIGLLSGALILGFFSIYAQNTKPNLLIIHTDEHNFRTLGCYRDLLSKDQAFVWGKGVEVKTPNIDRIADEGAICMDYYATSPVCSPSRASLMTGLYPPATGVYINGYPLREDLQTFAEVLTNNGYATSYVGKWHLYEGPLDTWEPDQKTGFTDMTYMVNCIHHPYIKVNKLPHDVEPLKMGKYRELVKQGKTDNIQFLTDYLTDRTLDILERDKNKPFCLMLSIPDPHTPDIADAPFDKMYADMDFKLPNTSNLEYPLPLWASNNNDLKNNVSIGGWKPKDMANYFGMVKIIDNNVGRILKFLDDNNLTDNTIVIFTSDHGDMCFEHNRRNKGIPYEASARIPFVIRYPKKIKPGKVIETAYTTADFAPSMLGLMEMPQIDGVQHGMNDANAFTCAKKHVKSDRTVFVTTYNSLWGMVTDGRYKLITSLTDVPYLFDLEKDPDELVNFYNKKKYRKVQVELHNELSKQMRLYTEPVPYQNHN